MQTAKTCIYRLSATELQKSNCVVSDFILSPPVGCTVHQEVEA